MDCILFVARRLRRSAMMSVSLFAESILYWSIRSRAKTLQYISGGRRCVTADGGVRPNRGLGLSPSGVRGSAPRRKFSLFYSHFYSNFHVSINYQIDP